MPAIVHSAVRRRQYFFASETLYMETSTAVAFADIVDIRKVVRGLVVQSVGFPDRYRHFGVPVPEYVAGFTALICALRPG